MIKYIIREVEPECMDTSIMFDDDGLKAVCGFNNQLFILTYEHGRTWGFNADEYNDIVSRIDDFLSDFTDRTSDVTRKDVMKDYEITYNPTLCHKLTVYADKTPYIRNVEDVAIFLTLTTGRKWETAAARGYCQGDYAEILYCIDFYTEEAIASYGDYFFGCCKEFCVVDIDDDGNEIDNCYGFFVADSEIKSWSDTDKEYKSIVCNAAGIDEAETSLELIDGYTTTTNYRTV